MANTTADKLKKLQDTKEALRAALTEKGQTVGDVFSAYANAIRACGGQMVKSEFVNSSPDALVGEYPLPNPTYMIFRIIAAPNWFIPFILYDRKNNQCTGFYRDSASYVEMENISTDQTFTFRYNGTPFALGEWECISFKL